MQIEITKKYVISENEILELIKAHLEKTLGSSAPKILVKDILLYSPYVENHQSIDITAEYTVRHTETP